MGTRDVLNEATIEIVRDAVVTHIVDALWGVEEDDAEGTDTPEDYDRWSALVDAFDAGLLD